MSSCKLVIKDEVNIKFENLDLDWRKALFYKYSFELPYSRYLPVFKLRGIILKAEFFRLSGDTYLYLIDEVIKLLNGGATEIIMEQQDGSGIFRLKDKKIVQSKEEEDKVKTEWKNKRKDKNKQQRYSYVHLPPVYIDIDDKRDPSVPEFKLIDKNYLSHIKWPKNHIHAEKNIELRDYQVDVINKFLANHQSIQEIATGAGKTIITAALCQLVESYGRTITIVPNKSLVTQTEEDFLICNLDTGVYYGDRKEIGRYNTIATWQSLNVLEKKAKDDHTTDFKEFIKNINTIIIDEVHMAKANVLKNLLTGPFAHCKIRWGLSGTIPKEEHESYGLKCSIGEVANKIAAKELQDKGVLAQCNVNVLQTQDHPEFKNYQEELKWLTTDETRMTWIAKTITDIASTGNTMILVDRISAGELLEKKIPDSVFISGATKNTERKEHYDEVSIAQHKVIIATYGVASVGINIPRIFNLVLIEPGKSFVRVIQSIGRGIRKAQDKDHVNIWDITSSCKFAKKHLDQRKKFYKEANYPYNIEKIDYENPYIRK